MFQKRNLTLTIKRKTLVPTKHQLNHNWRSDWKLVDVLRPEWAERNFSYFENGGRIKYVSEFTAFILRNFGEGEYLILAFKKGRKGFYSFLHFRCQDNGYMRLQAKRRIVKFGEHYDEECDQYVDDLGEINTKRGASPYLASHRPTYRVLHSYNTIPLHAIRKAEEENNKENNEEEKRNIDDLWKRNWDNVWKQNY